MAGLENKYATKTELKRVNDLMVLVIIVLFIGFAALFVSVLSLVINANGEKHASYQDLRDQVQTQDAKIDVLINSYNQTIRQQQASQPTSN